MSSRSYLIAGGIVLATTAWLASGYVVRGADGEAPPSVRPATLEQEPMRVAVARLDGETVVRELTVQGEAEPGRSATLRFETDGRIGRLLVERGADVRAGEPLLELDLADREARLAQARALVEQRVEELQAASKLRQQGYQAQVEATRARAQLAAARAELAAAQLDIERTVLRAPFDGVLDRRTVELGEAVRSGDAALTVVDVDPLVVTGQVPQHAIGRLAVDEPARVKLATGETVEGRVRYIAQTSDPGTRTFRVEVAVANPDGRLPAGVSAELRFAVEQVDTHFISPALLALGSDGRLGVKTVDAARRVVFHPVRIVRSAADGLWVAGLPERPRVITAGQGFVAAGETVIPDPDDQRRG